jgi:hypothetical protein
MSIKCKDIITNMKYLSLSQNVMKSVDLIKLIVAINSSTVHLYFVARQRTGISWRSSPARRQDRLLMPRSGEPSVVGPADGPARCAAALRHNFCFSLDMSITETQIWQGGKGVGAGRCGGSVRAFPAVGGRRWPGSVHESLPNDKKISYSMNMSEIYLLYNRYILGIIMSYDNV